MNQEDFLETARTDILAGPHMRLSIQLNKQRNGIQTKYASRKKCKFGE